MTPETTLALGNGRVWIQTEGPNTSFQFLTAYGAGALARPGAPITPYYEPSRANHNQWVVAGKTQGVPGLPTASLESYFKNVTSLLMSLRCPAEIQWRFGVCDRPDNPNAWDKILHLKAAVPGDYNIPALTALIPTNQAPMTETLGLTGEDVFEVLPITGARVSVAETANALSIGISQVENCAGLCGPAVSICDEIYIGTQAGAYATANLLRSADGGAIFTATDADPLAVGANIVAVMLVGNRVIVVDGTTSTPTIAYSDDNGATWSLVTSGSATGDANDGFAVDWAHIFICANAGRILSWDNSDATLTTLSNGTATLENLNKIVVLPSLTGYCVGNNGAVLKTIDGVSWSLVTAPVAANLTVLDIIDENRVWVGTAGGELWYTEDGGTTWNERSFSGTGTGQVIDLKFVAGTGGEFGFMLHQTAGGSDKLFRTIDGGKNWSYNDNGIGSTPTNGGLNMLGLCGINSVFVVGDAYAGTAEVLKFGN